MHFEVIHNVKQNKYDPYRFTDVSTAVWSCVVCVCE